MTGSATVCASRSAVNPRKDQIVEDRFDGVLDTAKWIPFGQPIPRIVDTPDNERVLFLNGDGVWIDGILGRDTFTLNRGATLELEFRYRTGLHRTDRQTALFCLVRYDLPEPHPARLGKLDDERFRQQACFSYPSDERRRFDPAMAYLSVWPSTAGDHCSRSPRPSPRRLDTLRDPGPAGRKSESHPESPPGGGAPDPTHRRRARRLAH